MKTHPPRASVSIASSSPTEKPPSLHVLVASSPVLAVASDGPRLHRGPAPRTRPRERQLALLERASRRRRVTRHPPTAARCRRRSGETPSSSRPPTRRRRPPDDARRRSPGPLRGEERRDGAGDHVFYPPHLHGAPRAASVSNKPSDRTRPPSTPSFEPRARALVDDGRAERRQVPSPVGPRRGLVLVRLARERRRARGRRVGVVEIERRPTRSARVKHPLALVLVRRHHERERRRVTGFDRDATAFFVFFVRGGGRGGHRRGGILIVVRGGHRRRRAAAERLQLAEAPPLAVAQKRVQPVGVHDDRRSVSVSSFAVGCRAARRGV